METSGLVKERFAPTFQDVYKYNSSPVCDRRQFVNASGGLKAVKTVRYLWTDIQRVTGLE